MASIDRCRLLYEFCIFSSLLLFASSSPISSTFTTTISSFSSSTSLFPGRNLLQSNNPPASNLEAFFPSNPIPAFTSSPPLSPTSSPSVSPIPSSTPTSSGGNGGSVTKAVIGTAFGTFALCVLLFFVFYWYDIKRRQRNAEQEFSKYAGGKNRNPYAYPFNNDGTSGGKVNVEDDNDDGVKAVIVDENGLDVLYWRKLEEGGANLCSYCKRDLNYPPSEGQLPEHDDDEEQGKRGGGKRGHRRKSHRNQETPLLPFDSVRSSDPDTPPRSSLSASSDHHLPPRPPPTRPFQPLPPTSSPSASATAPPPPSLPLDTAAVPPLPLPPAQGPASVAKALTPPRGPPPSPPLTTLPMAAGGGPPSPTPTTLSVAAGGDPPPQPPPTRPGPPGGGPPPPLPPMRQGAAGKAPSPPPPPRPPSGPNKGPPAPPTTGGRPPPPGPRPPPPMGSGGPVKRAQLPPPAKFRPLHWDKMTTANVEHSMVWDKIPSDGSFRIDNDDLMVALFGTAITRGPKQTEPTPDRRESGGQSSSNPQVVLLDPRKSQNIAIVLRSLAISRKTIIDALLDGHGLAPEILEKLSHAPRPTKDEEALVRGFSDDPSKLADAEAFLHDLLQSVPAPFDRLDTMLFKSTFDNDIVQIKDSFLILNSASKELRGSAVFTKFLEVILKTGNKINAGTARGNAQAFNLTSLRKLADVKSMDGKTTLLHFLVEEVIRSEGKRCVVNKGIGPSYAAATTTSSTSGNTKDKDKDEKEREYLMLGLPVVGGLSIEFSNVKKAAMIDYDALLSMCTGLESKVKGLARFLTNSGDAGDFTKEMKIFLESAENKLNVIGEEKVKVMELVTRTTEYYVVGASKDKNFAPLQLFVVVKDFLIMVDQVCIDVTRKLQQQQQQKKKKKLQQQQQQQKQQQQQEEANTGEIIAATDTPLSGSGRISEPSVGSGRMSESPSESRRRSPVRFPNLPAHFLRRNSSDSESDSDDDFAN